MTDVSIFLDKKIFEKKKTVYLDKAKEIFCDRSTYVVDGDAVVSEFDVDDGMMSISMDVDQHSVSVYIQITQEMYTTITKKLIEQNSGIVDAVISDIITYSTKKFNKMKTAFESIK